MGRSRRGVRTRAWKGRERVAPSFSWTRKMVRTPPLCSRTTSSPCSWLSRATSRRRIATSFRENRSGKTRNPSRSNCSSCWAFSSMAHAPCVAATLTQTSWPRRRLLRAWFAWRSIQHRWLAREKTVKIRATIDGMEMRIFTLLAMGLCLAGLPALAQPKAAGAPDPTLIEDLVVANRVLADLGVLDGFGHVSVRHDKDANRYLMSRSMAPALVKADDILEYDLDSVAVDAKGQALFLERFIHGEIYKARPDVRAVVHSHSPSVIPFGVSRTRLQPIYHMSSFMGLDVPVFEIRDIAGPSSDLLVRDAPLGVALAKALADKTVVLMRGHGSVTVGTSIPQVVFRAYYAEMNARLQSEAIKLGAVTYLTAEEAAASAKTNDALVMRPWELWKRKVMKPE